MGKFRDAMSRQMALRGFAPATHKAYLSQMRCLVRQCGRPPDELSEGDVLEYFRSLASRGASTSTINQSLAAGRVLFREVLHRDWSITTMRYQKAPQHVPEVLSVDEVQRLLDAAATVRERSLYELAYGAGLRLSEALHLRISDIDSDRMAIRIHRGKGSKDRYVPLPVKVLETLRDYYRRSRPTKLLFPSSRKPNQPLDPTGVQRAFQLAVGRARIGKRVSYHSLRHTFATHQLEAGVKPHVLKRILGHRCLATTERYLHVAADYLKTTPNPLDALPEKTGGEPQRKTSKK